MTAALPTPAEPYDPDFMLSRLMQIGKPGTGFASVIAESEVMELLATMLKLFMDQPMCIECVAPVTIVGDIHGQYNDLIRMFNVVGWPPTINYLCLGDYVDRGKWNVEVMLLLFCLKLKFPENFLILRGNHETVIVNRIYGFYEDCVKRFGNPRLYNAFQDVFNVMPLSAVVSDRILCMHGGLSPELLKADSLQILQTIARPKAEYPNPSLPIDLLWADPDIKCKDFKMSIRGVSCTFGPSVLNKCLEKFGLDLVVRAHQVVQDGYEFFNNKKLVTVFSAPHYCGQFDNAAAVMLVNKDLKCSFKIMRPAFPGTKIVEKVNKDITCYGAPPPAAPAS